MVGKMPKQAGRTVLLCRIEVDQPIARAHQQSHVMQGGLTWGDTRSGPQGPALGLRFRRLDGLLDADDAMCLQWFLSGFPGKNQQKPFLSAAPTSGGRCLHH